MALLEHPTHKHPESWGLCKACRFWQAEHDGSQAEDFALGLCVHEELTHFGLQLTGHSGCNRFTAKPEVAAADAALV